MRYYVTFSEGKEPEAVDLEPVSEGHFAVTLRGVRHEVDARALPEGTVSLLLEGRAHAVEIEENGNDRLSLLALGQLVRLHLLDERRHKLAHAKGGFAVSGKVEISAPMPGKVVRVLVKQGEKVAEGQGLVVVEAMKMENELKSPKAGTVTALQAQEGMAVEMNAKLLVVE
ncbi:MAG: biotin/lipoyl-containing protein [Myxococcaceae bacterium]